MTNQEPTKQEQVTETLFPPSVQKEASIIKELLDVSPGEKITINWEMREALKVILHVAALYEGIMTVYEVDESVVEGALSVLGWRKIEVYEDTDENITKDIRGSSGEVPS